MRLMLAAAAAIAVATPVLASSEFVVHETSVEDRKAVIATVEPVRQLVARARIGGTVTSLKVREGDEVGSGDRDRRCRRSEARAADAGPRTLASGRSRLSGTRCSPISTVLRELQQRGVSSQVQLEQARTRS